MLTVSDGGSDGSYVPEGERSSALGAGGRFLIDPDQVQALASGIDQAIQKLDVMSNLINQTAQVAPPGRDPFSAAAVDEFNLTADGGPAALLATHAAYRQLLIDTKKQILADAAAARGQDGATAGGFNAGS